MSEIIKDERVGEEHGIYKIIGIAEERAKDGHLKYVIQCKECGCTLEVLYSFLKRKDREHNKCCHVTSWGGRVRNHKGAYRFKNRKIASIYNKMMAHCYNSNHKEYKWYGARGCYVCDEWRNNPEQFEKDVLELLTANPLGILTADVCLRLKHYQKENKDARKVLCYSKDNVE